MKKIVGAHFPPFDSVKYTKDDEKMSEDFRDKFLEEVKEPAKPNPKYTPPESAGCKAPEYRRMTEAPSPKPAHGASEYITIPVAEYMYLQRLDALMDVLLLDAAYSSAHTIQAVKDAVLAMRMAGKEGAEE